MRRMRKKCSQLNLVDFFGVSTYHLLLVLLYPSLEIVMALFRCIGWTNGFLCGDWGRLLSQIALTFALCVFAIFSHFIELKFASFLWVGIKEIDTEIISNLLIDYRYRRKVRRVIIFYCDQKIICRVSFIRILLLHHSISFGSARSSSNFRGGGYKIKYFYGP